jgi:hypothetical protein
LFDAIPPDPDGAMPDSTPTTSSDRPRLLDRLAGRTAALWTLAALATVTLSGCGRNLFEHLQRPRWGICTTLIIILDIVALVDLLGDRGRSAGNKVIWTLAIVFMPVVGVLLYFFIGR